MDPKVAELSERFADKARFIKVIGDKSDNDGIQIMRREGVRTVPLYQIYKDGQKVNSVSGADAEALTKNIEKHTGWTLHSAAGLPDGAPARLAWAVSYVADGAKLLRLRPGAVIEEEEDAVSFEPWIGDVPGGATVDHPLVPLVPVAS